ncbi:MAG: hybrid sensor histidine kinase/response regulator, partial [Bacteroidales bacterium]|nr:hybrid sensor histidine kinase/response regulator [Bacteroidales bacterium]
KRYNRYDGLPENQFNFNSAFVSSAGRVYFGTYNGLISFLPAELKRLTTNIPPVSFTGYTLLGEDRSTLESHFMDNSVSELYLEPYQLFISIEFSTLGFSRTRNVDYEIRMAGESMGWDRMENSRTLTLTNLGKGWHTLEVRAVMDGLMSPEISTLRIYRQPAIWQTTYAFIFYLLVLVTIFFFVRREYLRRQNARHTLALERFEKENQKKLNEQKMRFFLNISHEFRTPLTIIGGTISNIINKFNVEKELEKKLDIIQNTSENLNKLVNDFLEYGRLESGFKPLELKKGPVMLFIRKACDMFDNWAEVNQLVYHKAIDDNREMAFFDQFKLERIIYNLLSNAFKFNKSHGEVKVEARIQQGEESLLELVVSDSGSGIDSATLSRIRRKFADADASGMSEKGIGLTYIAGLVRQMGGRISVESENGKGSVFSVRLPLLLSGTEYDSDLSHMAPVFETPEQEEEPGPPLLNRDENRPHILVIDDHADLLEMLSDALRPDFNVTVSGSPLKALELVRRNDYELVICDIMMPEMNGFEVIEKIHSDILTSHV